jgi:molecular chaperone DnaK
MTDLKEKISTTENEESNTKIDELRSVLSTDDLDAIQEKHKVLQEASWKVTQQAYQNGSDKGEGSEEKTDGEKKEQKQ